MVSRVHDDVIFIAEGGEERVTCKNSKEAESPVCTKIEHSFAQVCSPTIYDLTTQCHLCSQQDVNAPSLPGKFYLHRNGCQPFLTRGTLCYNAIHA